MSVRAVGVWGRSRWLGVVGVVVLVVGAGGVLTSSAASVGSSSFVPITPCRLLDTREGSANVGLRSFGHLPVGRTGGYDA